MRLTEALRELILLKTEPLYLPSESFHFFSTASPSETKKKTRKEVNTTFKNVSHKKTSKCKNKNQRKKQTKQKQNTNKRQKKTPNDGEK